MAKNEQPLTCTFFVGGKPVEKLTPEQSERMAQMVSEVMSLYYTANPAEYSKIKKQSIPKDKRGQNK